jgi:hypothetical protein
MSFVSFRLLKNIIKMNDKLFTALACLLRIKDIQPLAFGLCMHILYSKCTCCIYSSKCNLHMGKPRSASEGSLQLDGGFLKNEAIHCYKHKSHCQIEPMKSLFRLLRAYPTHDLHVIQVKILISLQ